ncbi:Crp/Fnr family transcriptional regulator [Curvibacter sp. APW13]|uniref:Crp/Fnr family transcriptional regulator n=1 Tax=Curvibacter sp. APW13 TaxID=3077236 RepID=UPI0028DFDDBD|nr:Crp/Fnr family transcriptional regulator [Curvibacter sp. APW13]MDT8990331.1 Crp/Fnr family transcriptional regulator [Curvibacter sp. APW13]
MRDPSAELLQLLRGNPWFGALPVSEQMAMLERAEPMQLARGALLYGKGSVDGGFYGLVRGVVKISSVGADGREGILALIEAGNWFNESTLLDGLPNPYDATALEALELLVISPEGFGQLMQRLPFVQALARLEALRLRVVFGMVEDTMVRNLGARVARRLLVLAHGDATMAEQARARVLVSQDALAMMLGVTRPSLWKALGALVDAGVVALGYGRIDILDVPALERIAERS